MPRLSILLSLLSTTTMFPSVGNQHEESLASWIDLQQRVLSWLHGIQEHACSASSSSSSSSSLSSFTHHSKTRKRHHYSPYPQTRHHEPPRAPSPVISHTTGLEVISTLQSDFPASASEVSPIRHVKGDINKVKYHTTSLIEFKVADDLPDPEYNPLASSSLE